jgi:hypothetical protein
MAEEKVDKDLALPMMGLSDQNSGMAVPVNGSTCTRANFRLSSALTR